MKKNAGCKGCSIRGYSPEFCTLHHKFMPGNNKYDGNGFKRSNSYRFWREDEVIRGQMGKTLAVGACAGVLTSALGLSAACLIGLKAMCETLLTAKVVAGAGMAGVVTSIAVNSSGGAKHSMLYKRRRHFIPPLYFADTQNSEGVSHGREV